MASKDATKNPQTQTVKQLRGQISALARENRMLHHKMDLLEQNSTLKQNEILSSFLTWMEDKGGKSMQESRHQDEDSVSPAKPMSAVVKQKYIPAAGASKRLVDREDVATLSTGSAKSRPAVVRNSSESPNGNYEFDVSSKKARWPAVVRNSSESPNDHADFNVSAKKARWPAEVGNFSESPNDNAEFDVSSKKTRWPAIVRTKNGKESSTDKEGRSDAGLDQSWDGARFNEIHDTVSMDNHSKEKGSRPRPYHDDFIPSTPVRIPYDPDRDSFPTRNLWDGPAFYSNASPRYLDESAPPEKQAEIAKYWFRRKDDSDQTQLRQTPMTSTPKKVDVKRAEQPDLEDKVRNLLDETKLAAASPEYMHNVADDVNNHAALRRMTSTPAKTPSQKRVAFADEIQENVARNERDTVSSVPRAYNCDPLNLFTPDKTPASASRQLSYPEECCLPADEDRRRDYRDEHSLRRLTLNDNSDLYSRRRSDTSKRPTTSRKDNGRDDDSRIRNIGKEKGYESKSLRENYSAKRDLPIDVDKKRPDRSSVDTDKLFNSRENDYLNGKMVMTADNQANYHDNQASVAGESRNKRSRYEGVTNTTPEKSLTPRSPSKRKSQSPRSDVNSECGIANDDATIEILENELQDIYKQNLDDEVRITEIRRNAVRRFDGWREAMESEMSKLEQDGRDRLVRNLDKLSQSLPACLKCDCSTGFDGNSMSVAISEGRLSELADGSGLTLADLEQSRDDSINRSATEESLPTQSTPKKHGKERKRSADYQNTSLNSSFIRCRDSMIFGEIAFQLERVVLTRVFRGGSKQLTGYTLSNMEKMIESHYDYGEKPMLRRQLDEVKVELHICGWNHDFHPKLVAHLIKKFGTFPTNVKAISAARKRGWMEPQALKNEVLWRIPKKYIHDMIIILDCLFFLSKKYNIPLFTW